MLWALMTRVKMGLQVSGLFYICGPLHPSSSSPSSSGSL